MNGKRQRLRWYSGLILALALGACGKAEDDGADSAMGSGGSKDAGGRASVGGARTGGGSGDGGADVAGAGADDDSGGRSAGGNATSGGAGGGAAGGAASAGGAGGSPSESFLWYFVVHDGGWQVINLLKPSESVAILGSAFVQEGLVPWSPDGTSMAQVVEGKLTFYDLTSGGEVSGTRAAEPTQAEYIQVEGWVSGHGPVVSGLRDGVRFLAIAPPEDDEILIDEPTSSDNPASFSSSSPDGRFVLLARPLEQGYAMLARSLANGQAGEAELVFESLGSPALGPVWSSGGYLGFGISGPSGSGIYLWRSGSLAELATPENSGYAPFFGFGPDGSRFMSFVSSMGEAGLYEVDLRDGVSFQVRPLGLGVTLTPAVWTPFGDLLYEAGEMGLLQTFNDGGSPGSPLALTDYRYGCPAVWVSSKDIFFTRCLGDKALMYGALNDASAEVFEVAPTGLENLELSPRRNCLLEWDESTVLVGRVDSTGISTAEVGSGAIRNAGFSPDGTQVVWIDEGVGLYRRQMEGCVPKGDPILVLEMSGPASQAAFLPHPQ